ncbi:hypothetical protein [Paenibacillus sp. DMB20]|uniref:hypothetical protein n=1 Tax=Paenibacillus sp. DMB20 TaxID=1642570 RepID=UPI001F411566|nr:hypothetical protein [Paenibacillus sp. DMB20]
MALTQGDLIRTFAWLLIGMLLIRMVLTPLIHAGIYYNLHQEAKGERGLFFFQGMKRLWKPVTLFYILETLLVFAPAYWLLPKITPTLLAAVREPSVLMGAVPYIACWLLYACLIRLVLLYMQFGKTSGNGIFSAVIICSRHIGKAAALTLSIGGTAVVLQLLFSGFSLMWAGLAGLILQQASYFIGSLFQLWGIAAQYHVWSNHARQS